jgi:hypothetical protein
MADALYLIIVIGLVIEATYAMWCVWDTRRHYNRRQIGSVVYDRLSYADTRTAIAALILLFLAVHHVLRLISDDWPSFAPWSTFLLVIALSLLLWGPISTRRMLKRIERGGSQWNRP